MPTDHVKVGVVAIKAKLKNPWVDYEWRPHAVLDGVPTAEPMTLLSREGEDEFWYVGPGEILMHSGETAHYRDNLVSGRPAVWVAIRLGEGGEPRLAGVTVDPYEGEAFAEVVDDRVEALSMPAGVHERLVDFFEAHHVETEFFKRKRDKKHRDEMGEVGLGHPALVAGRRGERP